MKTAAEYTVENAGNRPAEGRMTLDARANEGLSEKTRRSGGWVTVFIKPVATEGAPE